MYAEERQAAIAELVRVHGRCAVPDLARQHEVSAETVRRDLLVLERAGLVRRVHGGAVSPSTLPALERAVNDRDALQADQKQRIAEAALGLLPDTGSVLLDAGTTTARVAALLPRDSTLTVITHALPIAARLADHPSCELHLLPGRVRPTTQAAVGGDAVEAIGRLRVDVLLLATNALSRDHGLSTPDHAEAATKRALMRAARRVVLLVDSSKLGLETTVRFGDLDSVDTVVTDDGASADDLEWVLRAGLEVVVA